MYQRHCSAGGCWLQLSHSYQHYLWPPVPVGGVSLHQVRQDPRQGSFYVEGLSQVPCGTLAAAVDVISAAMSWRHTRSHKLNNYSSRSHCLITLAIRRQEPGEGDEAGLRR